MAEALSFRVTCLWFGLRDRRTPPRLFLAEANLAPGMNVLDFGCRCGSYALATAHLVGPAGKVYAADINPLALQHSQRMAARQKIGNMTVIQTDGATGLPDAHVDVVLLYHAPFLQSWRVSLQEG